MGKKIIIIKILLISLLSYQKLFSMPRFTWQKAFSQGIPPTTSLIMYEYFSRMAMKAQRKAFSNRSFKPLCYQQNDIEPTNVVTPWQTYEHPLHQHVENQHDWQHINPATYAHLLNKPQNPEDYYLFINTNFLLVCFLLIKNLITSLGFSGQVDISYQKPTTMLLWVKKDAWQNFNALFEIQINGICEY